MEDLTKQQIILVALLVSFMTSISTGIVTVALVDQAPQGVTQTINQVVERTIEKVVPVPTTQTAEVARVQTKIVPAEELLPLGVEKATRSLVRVMGTVTIDPPSFMTVGMVVNKDGLIVAPRSLFVEGGKYEGVFADGSKVDLELVARNEEWGSVFLKVQPKEGVKVTLVPALFEAEQEIKIGKGAVVLSGEEKTVLGKGIITGVRDGLIDTDIQYLRAMGPLISYDGNVMGIRSQRDSPSGTGFISVKEIRRQMDLIAQPVAR